MSGECAAKKRSARSEKAADPRCESERAAAAAARVYIIEESG
jgi:hypothetical protein